MQSLKSALEQEVEVLNNKIEVMDNKTHEAIRQALVDYQQKFNRTSESMRIDPDLKDAMKWIGDDLKYNYGIEIDNLEITIRGMLANDVFNQ